MKLGLAAIGRACRVPTTVAGRGGVVGWPLGARLVCPLGAVLAGMPLGLAVTTTLAGAVPFDAPSVSHKASLVAFQLSVPAPALSMWSVEVCTCVAPAGKVQPNWVGPAVSVLSSRLRLSSTTTVMLLLANSPLLLVAVSVMAFVPTGRLLSDCSAPLPVP